MGAYPYHKQSDNFWIVLEGAMDSIVGGVRYHSLAGEVIFMPKNVPHRTGVSVSTYEVVSLLRARN